MTNMTKVTNIWVFNFETQLTWGLHCTSQASSTPHAIYICVIVTADQTICLHLQEVDLSSTTGPWCLYYTYIYTCYTKQFNTNAGYIYPTILKVFGLLWCWAYLQMSSYLAFIIFIHLSRIVATKYISDHFSKEFPKFHRLIVTVQLKIGIPQPI